MRTVYLDNAATTFPKPAEVAYAVKDCIDSWCGNPGRGTHALAEKSAEAVYSVREQIGEMFAGKPENAVFTTNATHAINLALKTLVPKGHVIISDLEHNAVVRPIVSGGLKFSFFHSLTSPARIEEQVRSLIRSDTRALVVSAGSNICGLTMPLALLGGICEERGLYFIVDGSQYVGTHAVNTEKLHIDALCAPGHKGLYGPQGSGFVLFSERAAKAAAKGATLTEGGNGVNSREALMPSFLPERHEAGTLAVPSIVGLGKGLEFVKKQGESTLFLKESVLYERALSAMTRMRRITVYAPGIRRSGILLFNINGMDSESAARALGKAGICVRGGLHCAPMAHAALGTPEHGAVRVSFGAFNTEDDVRYLLSAIDKMV